MFCVISLYRKSTLKNCDDIPLHPPADDFSIKQKIASAHEDEEAQKLLYTKSGNVKWCRHFIQYIVCQSLKQSKHVFSM